MADINNNYKDFKNLTSFKLCVLQNFPFIEADFDAVTNYQLLCKVVEYLNKLIDNNNTQNDNIKQLEQNFIMLYNYVKNYFDNLDVQEEINKKLDEMAADGSLSKLIQPLFDEYKTTIDSEVNTQNGKINVLENRMNTFTSLPSGSTSADAEIIDARIGANGIIYPNLGTAIRTQIDNIENNIDEMLIQTGIFPKFLNLGEYGTVLNINTGAVMTFNGAYDNNFYSINPNKQIKEISNNIGKSHLYFYNINQEFISHSSDTLITIPENAAYYRVAIWGSESEVINFKGNYYYSNNLTYESDFLTKKIKDEYIELQNYKQIVNDTRYIPFSVYNNSDAGILSNGSYYVNMNKLNSWCGFEITLTCDINTIISIVCPSINSFSVFIGGIQHKSVNGRFNYTFNQENSITFRVAHYVNDDTINKNFIFDLLINEKTLNLSSLERIVFNKELKKTYSIITLGDSITAINGGWVPYFIEATGYILIDNVAVSGATFNDKINTILDGLPTIDNPNNNTMSNQVQKILNMNYTEPDYIIIALGTNSGINVNNIEEIKKTFYDDNGNIKPLDDVDRTSSSGAYRWCFEKLHAKYPNSIIIWSTPILAREDKRKMIDIYNWGNNLKLLTQSTGQLVCDTMRCGIVGTDDSYFVDGLHLSNKGQKLMSNFIANFCEINKK